MSSARDQLTTSRAEGCSTIDVQEKEGIGVAKGEDDESNERDAFEKGFQDRTSELHGTLKENETDARGTVKKGPLLTDLFLVFCWFPSRQSLREEQVGAVLNRQKNEAGNQGSQVINHIIYTWRIDQREIKSKSRDQ